MSFHLGLALFLASFLGVQGPLCALLCAAPTRAGAGAAAAAAVHDTPSHPCHGMAPKTPDTPAPPSHHDCSCDEADHARIGKAEMPPPAAVAIVPPVAPVVVPVRLHRNRCSRELVRSLPPPDLLLRKESLRL